MTSDHPNQDPQNLPRDIRLTSLILTSLGVQSHQQKVPLMLLDFAYRYTQQILQDAQLYSDHAKSPSITVEDLRLAVVAKANTSFRSPPPKEFMLELAAEKNRKPLPPIGESFGLRLPPQKYCLTAPVWDDAPPPLNEEEDSQMDEV
ncbi:Transcription initiation factor TFIID subunit 9 [Neolecta irregularis DAH-3]|uniref:Transcription initiation factor TFIID subunit 9 n=1 Tax=Neolecta irregularis (strain DAH-3) TaxID=1198029 RepID=A0A1U7LNK6_NEOID|nr:Transcription initiation factor TFIID subunit 9 [Neolecta irregularis DAH-3]|eukprot:OLL24173.1 Transcription initiation factor TFIID subunit 9 [Neolecta irregularis DAH-3]